MAQKGETTPQHVRDKISKSLMGHPVSLETRVKLRRNRGFKHTPEARVKISQAGRRPCSEETRRKLSLIRGDQRVTWRGGITSARRAARKTLDYNLWREAVFKRDNWTCQECGQWGGKLQADHIKPFCLFPELRLEVSNGRTLCLACHRKTDTWGVKALRFIDKERGAK